MDTEPLFFPVNPYIAGNPVGGGEVFIGRADVLREVLRIVRSPHENALVLYGQRRIGKTSVLQELAARLPQEGRYHPVDFDLENKAALPLAQVVEQLAANIAHELALSPPPSWGEDAPRVFREEFLPHVLAQLPDKASLVLLFDEFDVLDNPSETQASAAFFPYLPKLLSLDLKRLKFIFVIGRRPEDLSSLTLEVFKAVKAYHLSLLPSEETAKLVRLAQRNGSLLWPDESITYIQKLTGGHPFLTQQLCQIVWERAYQDDPKEPPAIQPADIEQAIPSTLERATNSLEWLWNSLQPAERIVASALAEGGSTPMTQEELEQQLIEGGVRLYLRELRDAPRLLLASSLIIATDGGYRFPVELLRRWIAKRKPLNEAWQEMARLNPVANIFYQKGHGLYQAGHLEQAIEPLRQAVALNPNHLRANLLLAEVLLAQNEVAEARQLLESLYQYHPAAACPRLVQALLLQAQANNQAEEQLALYERVLELERNHRQATAASQRIWKKRGDAALAANNLKEALQAYERADLPKKVAEVRAALRERELLEPQTHFGGRYEIQQQIGRGGMASVYRALDTRLNQRDVALKVLSEQFAQKKELIKRFRNEAFAAAGLNHPNIIDVFDFGSAGNRYYIVMPYIPTGTLVNLFRNRGPLSPIEGVSLLAPIAEALHKAHQNHLVHRDIKPGNILIDEWGKPILADFGIARIMRQVNQMIPSNTHPATKIGTPYYQWFGQFSRNRQKELFL